MRFFGVFSRLSMPTFDISYLPHSEVKIAFEVTPEEAKPYLDEAVRDLTAKRPIPGFRPGKATYQDVKVAFGEMAIYETALERIVRANYVSTVMSNDIHPVGSPSINVDQLVPGQNIKFTVIAPIEPKVEKMPDFAKCKVTKKETKVGDKEMEDALEEMRKMRRQEVVVDRAATAEDLVVIDLEMKKDGVLLEGGAGRGHRVYLAENHYIPGFSKELVGVKKGDERTFTLPFPADHFQKNVAGQDVEFNVKTTDVYELQLPKLDEEFSKGVGFDTMDALKAKLKENMQMEQDQKRDEAAEIEMLEKLTDDASFTEVPEVLVNEEVRRMMVELQEGVEGQGMKWDDYLSSIKKTTSDLKMDFASQAIRRVKVAVLVKEIAKQEKIEVTDEEVDAEIDRILSQVPDTDDQTRERITSADYREYVQIRMRNNKALGWLKEKCMK